MVTRFFYYFNGEEIFALLKISLIDVYVDMAEAGPSNTSFSNICPFCDLKLNSQFLLGKHLLEVHNICVNTSLTRNQEEVTDKHQLCYYTATANSDNLTLGNKMKTLKKILKENFDAYTGKLKDWINCAISRKEFDVSVRKFFDEETIVIHNEFLICFLKEIRSINESSMKIIKKRSNFVSHIGIVNSAERPSPIPVVENITPSDLMTASPSLNMEGSDDVQNSTLKSTFPDEETLYALAIVHAWESGCTSVNKKIVPVLHNTIEGIIKIIWKAVLIRRKTLKVRPDGSEYDATKVDSNDVCSEDKFKYVGDFDVLEIIDALKAEPSLIPFKALVKVILEIMNCFEKRGSAKDKENA